MGSASEVFRVMLRLGTMAFGGPVAHLAHFQKELIEKRKWLPSEDYADLIAFCQFLPGPASSQVGMGLGLLRAGVPGMLAAWFAFSLPSVVLLLLTAAGIGALAGTNAGWIHGLMAGVVAIVVDAVVQMGKKLCPSNGHRLLAGAAAALLLLAPGTLSQMIVIAVGAGCGVAFMTPSASPSIDSATPRIGRPTMIFGWLLLALGVVAPVLGSLVLGGREPSLLNVYAAFAQTGSLVFGGGHVVLPMLEAEVVEPGWMNSAQFLAGYGVTQAMPGPIFTFGSYLGATIGLNLHPDAWHFFVYATAALLGLFLPSFAFMSALFPLWHRMRASTPARKALVGINAAVVGLLLAALVDPVITKAMNTSNLAASACIVALSWVLLVTWKKPAWLVVVTSAVAGAIFKL